MVIQPSQGYISSSASHCWFGQSLGSTTCVLGRLIDTLCSVSTAPEVLLCASIHAITRAHWLNNGKVRYRSAFLQNPVSKKPLKSTTKDPFPKLHSTISTASSHLDPVMGRACRVVLTFAAAFSILARWLSFGNLVPAVKGTPDLLTTQATFCRGTSGRRSHFRCFSQRH